VHAAIFGSIDEAGFAPGWTSERVISIFGSAKLDLTNRPPGEGAKLSAFTLLGSIEVTVPPGSRIAAGGISFLGSREIRVEPGDGPAMRMSLSAVLGSVEVKEPKTA
jgi:hypothetical protein